MCVHSHVNEQTKYTSTHHVKFTYYVRVRVCVCACKVYIHYCIKVYRVRYTLRQRCNQIHGIGMRGRSEGHLPYDCPTHYLNAPYIVLQPTLPLHQIDVLRHD